MKVTAHKLVAPVTIVFDSTFKPGTKMRISGSMPDPYDSFLMDFCCGEGNTDDIAMRMKPSFQSQTVEFSTRKSQEWTQPVIVKQNPFRRGQPFLLELQVVQDNYRVLVDGSPLQDFKYDTTQDPVRVLKIVGQVEIQKVERDV
ncbi:galectin-4 [Alligator mississippiensis]|uniref:Galectin n=1 Tax=Alligator mississippiensis TaxID=8496 RepID=A0A151PFS0_ALLMI|nr:galectin-4 [Alligator mississippiensis]KYO47936.1 hypothetical protein Y1Q_0004903 [Alligator mississippiensis]